MRRSIVIALFLSLAACASQSSSSAPVVGAEPADAQDEQDLTGGVTKLASKLQDPNGLTSQGQSVYFATTYGYATQEEAQYNHDIWVKTGSDRAKRLYKGLYGASWGMIATKNGLYEINEGYASIVRYPLDGSNEDGTSLLHAIYGQDEMPNVGIRTFDADDDGLVAGLRTEDDNAKAGDVVTLTPAGQNQKKIGTAATTAIKLAGAHVLVGTFGGDVLAGNRDGSGSLAKIATGEGSVNSIALAGDDVFFGSDKGIFVLRKGAAKADKLLGEGASDLTVVGDRLFYGQYEVGVSSLPLAGGASKLVMKSGAPSGILNANGYVFVVDRSLGKCTDTDEGQACEWDGGAFRIKL